MAASTSIRYMMIENRATAKMDSPAIEIQQTEMHAIVLSIVLHVDIIIIMILFPASR